MSENIDGKRLAVRDIATARAILDSGALILPSTFYFTHTTVMRHAIDGKPKVRTYYN